MIRLDIGCGPTVEEGWIGVDPMPGERADDLIVDRPAWNLPYDAATVDEIRCRHALEHFDPAMLDETMREWLRVLKPGGTVLVTVPDAAYVLQYLIDHPIEQWSHTMVYGRMVYAGDDHRTAWSQEKLENLLFRNGFALADDAIVKWDEYHQQDSIYLEARKRK